MAKYSYITDKTHNNRKIQVESAKRDGSGKNIENNYAKQNGNYQSLTAGLSNNFDTKQVMVDESAYNFRPTATMGSVGLEVGSPCKVKKIIGGSVAFNQLIQAQNRTETFLGVTYTYNSDGSVRVHGTADGTSYQNLENITGLAGHKLLILGCPKNAGASSSTFWGREGYSNSRDYGNGKVCVAGNRVTYQIYVVDGTELDVVFKPQIIDLTQMFGSTIADYIYSLEQANDGSGVAWFKRYFPKEYYAYNSGELVSVKTQGKKITHFNQWDEEWESGTIGWNNGQKQNDSTRIRSKNYIKVLPNTSYYFRISVNTTLCWYDKEHNYISTDYPTNSVKTSPANAYYCMFSPYATYGTTYKNDICINFHYDGERDGEYEPYNSETYACDDIELRGIPQLDENNNLAFNGDEYTNDGNVKRKYGTYTFTGEETFLDRGTTQAGAQIYVVQTDGYLDYLFNITTPKALSNKGNFLGMVDSSSEVQSSSWTKGFAFYNRTTHCVYFIGYTLADIVGFTIIYELETPTDENSIPFTEVQECDNWGTEEWLAPTTDTRPCEVPVGHETDYLPDLKAKLEVAPNTPNENGVYVMEHNASGNSYTPIATWLTENGYVKPTSISGYDSTKTQTLKNVEGVLTWVDD